MPTDAPPTPQDTDVDLVELAHAIAHLDHPIKTSTSAWAADRLSQHDRVEADHQSHFALDDWHACADRGIFGSMVPESAGGGGETLATTLLTLEGLGHGCRDNGLTYAVASQMLSTQVALADHGSPEQQEQWLAPMIAGTAFGAFGMTEVGSGSDAYAMSATATKRTDDSYVLNGHKAYITFGSICDMAIVFASTDPDAGAWGISAFVVPADADGFERVGNRDKMGMRTTPFGDIELHDVVVPSTAMLGRPGSGASIFNQVLQVERAFVFATQVGAMQRQLERAVDYAQHREQGGGPIARHQAVAHRLADMKRQHETARMFLYRAAIAKVSGTDFTMCAALAKLVGSETGITSAFAGADIHGAKGYVSEFEVERDLRDAIGGLVYSGTSDIQRNIIARLLGAGT